MAIAGQTPLRFMGLVPGVLKPTISISVLWILPQTLIMSGGSVSPSAVWYTGYIFVRSGYTVLNNHALRALGVDGRSWSRTATAYGAGPWDTKASRLYFNVVSTNPSTADVRWYGFPVRCLVYWLEKRKTLYFVRSGGQDLSVGTLRNAGINNVQWSNISSHYTNLNQSRSYSCAIVGLQTMASNTNERQVGFPVRCLVY